MATFGEELRRERELRDISLREIAESTKINLRFLRALEDNDFKHLPGGQFTKGFVRAYARHIGVDDEAMVNAYLYEVERQRRDAQRRGAAIGMSKVEARAAAATPRRRRTWLLLAGVLAAGGLLAALLLVWPGWLRATAPAPTAERPTTDDGAS